MILIPAGLAKLNQQYIKCSRDHVVCLFDHVVCLYHISHGWDYIYPQQNTVHTKHFHKSYFDNVTLKTTKYHKTMA